MLFEKLHPQHVCGTAEVSELAEKFATAVTSIFPLHFNSGMFVISACYAKSSKVYDLSDFNWKFPESLKCVNINILILRFL